MGRFTNYHVTNMGVVMELREGITWLHLEINTHATSAPPQFFITAPPIAMDGDGRAIWLLNHSLLTHFSLYYGGCVTLKNVSDSVRRHEKFYLLNISRTELIMFLKTDLLRAAWREVILLSNTDSRRRSRGQSPRSSATTGLEADIQTHSSWWLVWLGGWDIQTRSS